MTEVEKLFEEFKGRLVEVECECDNEKRAKCVMYPEYCDGTRKEIIDLVQLIDEGLNNKLLSDKDTRIEELEKENAEQKALIEKYRQAVDKCLHITFMGGGCEVNTIGQYATLVDGYLTDVEGLAKWKN